MKTIIVLLSLLASSYTARASDPDSSAFLFDANCANWIIPPYNVQFEADNDPVDSANYVRAVQVDLNADGVKENLFVSLCGNGGCIFEIHDGLTGRHLGDLFGNPIMVRPEKINGMPIVESFSHQSADSGNFTCYVFDGKEYVTVTSVGLFDKSVEAFFSSISNVRWLHK